MDKYLLVAKNSLMKNLVYRANTFITMFSVSFSFLVLFYFWNSIYRQGNQIGTYTLTQIISYYIFVMIFEMLFSDNTAWSIGDEIKNGSITSNFLRPIKFLEYKFAQSIGSILFRFLIYILPLAISFYALRNYLVFQDSWGVFALFAVSALLSFFLYFLVYFIVGVITFWTADAYGFLFACFVIVNFMQGGLIPLDLLPKWFAVLSNFLPFKYMFFVPVGIITGRYPTDISAVLIPLAWVIALYVFANYLFKKGIKKYEGFGI